MLRIALPVGGDLDAQREEHLLTDEGLDAGSGAGTHLLQARTALADDDALLAVALDPQVRVDVDELPHSIAVVVEEMGLREDRPEDKPLLDIHANLFVERSSQKGIVIGHKGSRLRAVGTAARHQIEAMLGTPVYLDLRVKIAKDWQKDPKQLRRLGF